MQVVRLVLPGQVDRMIAFDSLPERVTRGIKRGPLGGLPKYWAKFLECDLNQPNPRPFYKLDYKMINADKEKWSEINSYVRRNAGKEQHLLDKLEDMAIPMAPDYKSPTTIDPDDIPVIKLEQHQGPAESLAESAPPQNGDGRFGKKMSEETKKKMAEGRARAKARKNMAVPAA